MADANRSEKFRRWDNETARQESPGRPGYGAHDRALGIGSAGPNEARLREHIDRQYQRNPQALQENISGALNQNLTHDPSSTPRITKPSTDGTRKPKSYTPGAVDVVRSLDGLQSATAAARPFTEGQRARSNRKDIPVTYNKEMRQVRRDLRATARGVGKNHAAAQSASAALKAMPKPEASAGTWSEWAKKHGQTLPKPPTVAPASPMARIAEAGSQAQKAVSRMNPAMMLASGALTGHAAYKAIKDSGGSTTAAVGAGVAAGAPLAAAAAAPSVIGRFAPAAAGTLSRLALPLTVLAAGAGAVRGGVAAYKDGKSGGQVAKEAALGAADALTFGLAGHIHNKLGGDPTSLAMIKQAQAAKNRPVAGGNKPIGAPSDQNPQRLPPQDEKAFETANRQYAQQAQQPKQQESGAKGPGYKDVWTDSRGRNYKRQDLSVRKGEED